MRDDDDPAARVSAFSAAELRTSAEATTRGRADSDDSDAERATVPSHPWDADNRARPHPLFGLTRAERAYFDAAGSPMRARTTTYGSIAVDVADAGDDEEEAETVSVRPPRDTSMIAKRIDDMTLNVLHGAGQLFDMLLKQGHSGWEALNRALGSP